MLRMRRVAILACIATIALGGPCDVDSQGAGQKQIWVPNCTGIGCLANGVDVECAWCVYNMALCEHLYGSLCQKTKEAREAQNMSCNGESFLNAIFELDAKRQNSHLVEDLRSGIQYGVLNVTNAAGVYYWDLDNATLTRSGGGSITEGQEYTHAFWILWRPVATFRTLFHHSLKFPTADHVGDHCQFTQTHNSQCEACNNTLGVQSNRASPAWRPSGYEIDVGVWSFVVSVGRGDSGSSCTGETLFYVGYADPPKLVGSSDRVCSGMSYDRIGWPDGQGPGKLAQVWGWNRTLTPGEIADAYQSTRSRYYNKNSFTDHSAIIV